MLDVALKSVPEVITVAGVAAGTSVDLQPEAGEIWILAWAQGRHDDNGGARTCGFVLHDGVTSVNVGAGASITTGVCLPVYQTNPSGAAAVVGIDWAAPLVLNATMHLTFAGVAIGAGKKLYIDALVYKIRGVGPWSNT